MISRVNLLKRAIWIAVFLAVWEITAALQVISPLILPSLGEVGRSLYEGLATGEILLHTGVSLSLVIIGILLGCLLAAVLAMLSYTVPILASGVDTLTAIAHPLPGIALLPLVIMWFGTSTASIIFIIVHAVLWPMLINIRTGFSAVPGTLIDTGKNYELSRLGCVVHILFPASASYVLAGLRISWARSWRAVISAEMVFGVMGSRGGLGWYIFQNRVFMDSSGMFAGIIVLIVIGLIIEDAVLHVNTRTLHDVPVERGLR